MAPLHVNAVVHSGVDLAVVLAAPNVALLVRKPALLKYVRRSERRTRHVVGWNCDRHFTCLAVTDAFENPQVTSPGAPDRFPGIPYNRKHHQVRKVAEAMDAVVPKWNTH